MKLSVSAIITPGGLPHHMEKGASKTHPRRPPAALFQHIVLNVVDDHSEMKLRGENEG